MHGDGLRTPIWIKAITDDEGREHKWEAGILPDGSLVIKTTRPIAGITTVDVLEKVIMKEVA